MKRLVAAFSLLMVILVGQSRASIEVTVIYTADNVTAAFYQDGAAPISIGVGANYDNWRIADTTTLSLDPSDAYQLIFRVENDGSLSSINPAGFLADISGGIVGGEMLSSSSGWEYAIDTGGAVPADFGSLTWTAATEYGNNGGSNIWTSVNHGPVASISSSAQWIWSDVNFSDTNPVGGDDHNNLWLRTTITTIPAIPEPASLAIWSLIGLSWMGLSVYRSRRRVGGGGTPWPEENRIAIRAMIDSKLGG